jgi:flagellar assembly protein FliH
MSSNKGFSDDELNDAKPWDLPFVEQPEKPQDKDKTNALNFRSDWKYEPPEEEEAEILPPTAQEIEAIRQAAHDEGYGQGKAQGFEEGKAEGLELGLSEGRESGHTEGLEQGLEEGKGLISAQVEVWQQLIEKLHTPLSQANDETRDQLVKLAVTLAKSVIKTEITSNHQVILQALSEGMKALPVNQTRYQIHMHPDDIALVTEHYSEATLKEKEWQFIEAPTMERGGCDIATEQNAVDVSIERRCRDVIDKFMVNQGLSDD